jgi:UDP-N-acetylmuramyl pentapeptide phosphotransferase/UDP-N-acetylglucosamine-1-phosphate transferase
LAWPIELALAIFLAACAICYVLLLLLKPVLGRYALAKPNARSSHKSPTPQGGGIAVVAATIAAVSAAVVLYPTVFNELWRLAAVLAAAIGLAAVGIADDVRPIGSLPRLLLQAAAVAILLTSLPTDLHVFAVLPWWIERALMFGALLWFVNLVNFMDGIDWMTVAEIVPVLGDVGSLPIGLFVGWLLLLLASRNHLAAAVLLPLYYVADATITLLRRLVNGERLTQAHRSHFYQRALDGGSSVNQIVGRVFAVNIILAALAAATIFDNSPITQITMFAIGCTLVGALLFIFNSAYRPHQ